MFKYVSICYSIDMEDILAMISGVTASDVISLGSISAAILAIITLGKHLAQFLIESVKFICWIIWKLILLPAFYICMWVFQGITFLMSFFVDKLRRLRKRFYV